MNTLIVSLIAVCISATTVHAQLVSSDPDFAREGTAPYSCTTPKGKKTTCNRWHGTVRKSGWQRKCVFPDIDSMLQKLPGSGAEIYLEPPATGCSMLFHELWADTRNWAAKNQKKENRRTLKAGQLNQYVQVTEAGIYEFGACMVRNIEEDAGVASANGIVNTGGMVATLLQWHANDTATVHTVLPNNKTRFGPQDNPLVNVPHRLPPGVEYPESSTPGDEIGSETSNTVLFYYANGLPGAGFHHAGMWGQVLDGFEGHSGTGGKYASPGVLTDPGYDAYWTCYDAALPLQPGFYALRVEVQPYLYLIGQDYVSDYTGYGALSNVYLNRVQ